MKMVSENCISLILYGSGCQSGLDRDASSKSAIIENLLLSWIKRTNELYCQIRFRAHPMVARNSPVSESQSQPIVWVMLPIEHERDVLNQSTLTSKNFCSKIQFSRSKDRLGFCKCFKHYILNRPVSTSFIWMKYVLRLKGMENIVYFEHIKICHMLSVIISLLRTRSAYQNTRVHEKLLELKDASMSRFYWTYYWHVFGCSVIFSAKVR